MLKTTIYHKPMGEKLFDEDFTIEPLYQLGNPLVQLTDLIDFELFRPTFENVLRKTPTGRIQIDVVLMFMVIFLQR